MTINRFRSVFPRVSFVAFSLMLSVSAASSQNAPAISHAAGEALVPEQLVALFQPFELEVLSLPARKRALDWLQGLSFSSADLGHIHVDVEGGVYFADRFPDPFLQEPVQQAATLPQEIAASDVFSLHSHPGASKVVYLDFDGHVIENTAWNNSTGVASYEAVPYDLDGNAAAFSNEERSRIGEIWHRIAEDLAPFDIDVTTEEPAAFNSTTGHVLITRSTTATGGDMPSKNAGGVAYVDVFGRSNYATYYSPALVYFNHLGGGSASSVAEAASHEFGHNLGLSHDGTSQVGYYSGHGDGFVSWAPIMGVGYYKNVTQWSKGEYPDANQTQDDLAIIDGKLGYRGDDHGDTPATATALAIEDNGDVLVSDPESDPFNDHPENKGVIERRTDVDVFSLDVAEGPLSLTVTPAWKAFYRDSHRGANMDVSLRLLNASGTVIANDDPADNTDATIAQSVSAGRYYLEVDGVGNSVGQGYSDYGSLGQYFISGSVTPVSTERYTIGGTVTGLGAGSSLTLQNNGGDNLGISANGNFAFATQLSDGATYRVTVLAQPGPTESCSVANGQGTVAGADVNNIQVSCRTADTTPDPFSFATVADVQYDPRVTTQSESVTVTGIDAPAAVSVQGGEYRINGGNWQSGAGQISNNEQIQLRHLSSGQPATRTTTTLNIGGVSATFVSVTRDAPVDTTPDSFSFATVADVQYDPRVITQSESVTITGIDAPAAVSVQGGEYRINGGNWQSGAGQISNNEQIQLRHLSSGQPATRTTTTLDIGGVSATFVSVTRDMQVTPLSVNAGDDGEIVAVTETLRLGSESAAQGGVTPYQYAWTVSAAAVGADFSLVSADSATPEFSAVTPGDYTLTLTVRDDRDQVSDDSVRVRVVIPDQRTLGNTIDQSLSACESIVASNAVLGGNADVTLLAPVVGLAENFSVPAGAVLKIVSEADSWCTSH
ncbi:PKD domain-containing protein [Thiolapillus sp.]